MITSVVLVAVEIASRLNDVDLRNSPADIKWEELMEMAKQWKTRLEAHAAIVLACQAKGTNPANPEALEALKAYESLSGKYEAPGFSNTLMREYFNTKYGAKTPSTGEVPEELKADPEWKGRMWVGQFSLDQFLRATTFGTREPEWKKAQRARARAEAEGEAEGEAERMIKALFDDPWGYYSKELELLGLKRQMTYREAQSVFRAGVMARKGTFIRMDTGTPEYAAAMKDTAAFLGAWGRVKPLYEMKQAVAEQ